eukprot:gnl/TRDRNA2_/TRDRNA2_56841_c0_seq1.p1 gnl/TRDRNA2_/TRDRNA2_56841_c0~~gnl/TRDRNA2_/TRDRNA2_56841_c0_seq1.p1  ORF type:complete len:351 (-),score=42.75 gnl/TRDRNA2_/TRDRNA2_56841_c0_seq1:172-1224(-)
MAGMPPKQGSQRKVYPAGRVQNFWPATMHPQQTELPPFKNQQERREAFAATLEAVRSLYADRIEPVANIVCRRVTERTGRRLNFNDMMSLVDYMDTGEVKVIHNIDGDKKRSLFVLEPVPPKFESFIDPTLLDNPYPEELWDDLRRGIDELAPNWEEVLGKRAKSRYELARFLQEQEVPSLRQYCLGELCHIIQLAVQMQLLGYKAGTLVPFDASEACTTLVSAEDRKPMKKIGPAETFVTSWDECKVIFSTLLEEKDPSGELSLSSLKARIRSRFKLELSVTVFGHTKLKTFVEDPRLADICRVKADGPNFHLVPAPGYRGLSEWEKPLADAMLAAQEPYSGSWSGEFM